MSIPRILSIAGPIWVYASIVLLAYGLWCERRKLDWIGIAAGLAGLAASFLWLPPVHRLFFDEDIYIGIAGNLAHAPVNQITVMGGPDDVQVSSYYKEPPGWPVLLSLVFLVTGRSETVAFWMARILFACAIAAVYHLAHEALGSRRQALFAAVIFGATPVCFWFSASAGTDIPAALLVVLGMWGLFAENGALAAAGFALASQTRLELLLLVPLVWISRSIPLKWKAAAAILAMVEVVHVTWVMSVAPVLSRAERVQAAFSPQYLAGNLKENAAYLLNPLSFSAVMVLAAIVAAYRMLRTPARRRLTTLPAAIVALFCVYLLFYAGSFATNPRYSIQLLAPIAVLSAFVMEGRAALLLLSIVLPYTRPYEIPSFAQALAADHRVSVRFAARMSPDDLIVSAEPEMFLNHGRRAMNAVFASERKDKLEEEIHRRKVWYHSGARTTVEHTQEWQADQWMKSNFELHPVESQDANGVRTAFYELLLK